MSSGCILDAPDVKTMNKKRISLGFSEIVKEQFRFLEHDFGYSVSDQKTTIVRYRLSAFVINVYHGRQSSMQGQTLAGTMSWVERSLEQI